MAKEEVFTQIEFYCRKYGHSLDKIELGLEFFAIHLICQEKEFFESILAGEDPQEADLAEYWAGGKDDLRIDGLLYNDDLTEIAVIQAAHRSKFGKELEEKAIAFFNSVPDWINPNVIEKGNSQVRELLAESSFNPSKQHVTLYFVTTLPINSENMKGVLRGAEEATTNYSNKRMNVEIKVLGPSELESRHVELANMRDFGLAEPISFEIQDHFSFEVLSPLRSITCAIKASSLADVYNRKNVKNKLFNQNIRLGITSNINGAISRTAIDPEDSGNFFYYNNGITATCSSFVKTGNSITATNLQVVNGDQTVTALARSVGSGAVKRATNAMVLFRLIETGEHNSKKNLLAENITRYQNTQNAVRESDFLSNEPFQLWLSKNLADNLSSKGICPGFYYQHKRGFRPANKSGEALTLERLAQLRHAIYYGPSISYNSPRLFWDMSERYYWEAFGSNGDECTAWNDSELAEIGLAITIDLHLKAEAKILKKRVRTEGIKSEESKYLAYLSRYVTAVVLQTIISAKDTADIPSFRELISSNTNFKTYVQPLVREARKEVGRVMKTSYGVEGNSRLAMARDVSYFESIVASMIDNIQSGLIYT